MKYWKHLLILFFLLVVFEGALRKWALPGYAQALYVLKDGVLLLAFALFALSRRVQLPAPVRRTWLPLLLGAFVFWGLMEMLNPRAPNFAVSLLGAKSYLLYLTLLVLVPAAFYEVRRPERLLSRYVFFIAVPVLLLGIYQFFQPTSHWINRYVAETEYITGILGHPRITGTFSYITGMSTFLIFNISLGLGLLLAGLQSRRRSFLWIGGMLLTLSLIAGPMNGSRSVFYFFALPLPILLYQIAKKRGMNARFVGSALGIALVMLALLQTNLATGWDTFLDRIEHVTDTERRVESVFLGPLETLDEAGLFGYGIGSTHQAAPRLSSDRPAHSWLPAGFVETTTTRTLLELGLPGFLILLFLKGYLAFLAYQVLDRARHPLETIIGVTALCFLIINLVGSVAFNTTAGAIYWSMAGVTVALWSQQQVRSAYLRSSCVTSTKMDPAAA